MANRSNSSRRRRGRKPTDAASEDANPAAAADAEAPDGSTDAPATGGGRTIALKPPEALKRLRDRVEQAVGELERLRAENTRLAERLRDLEARSGVTPHEATGLLFDDDPDALRTKIEGFIAAIDQHLDEADAS